MDGFGQLHARGLTLQDNTCLSLGSATLAKGVPAGLRRPGQAGCRAGGSVGPKPIEISGAAVSVYFAPAAGEGIDQLCARLLGAAKKVRLMAFVITDPDILTAMAGFKRVRANFRAIVDPAAISTIKKIKRRTSTPSTPPDDLRPERGQVSGDHRCRAREAGWRRSAAWSTCPVATLMSAAGRSARRSER